MATLKKPKKIKIPPLSPRELQVAQTTKDLLKAIEDEKERKGRGAKNRGE